ncbi:hypothetical protein G7Y89_g8327 [Cudoniella acicularis]|uniref:Uncharacterized protein n=1 Tax=Cudoniella acicularis TaxID=354080 RepID=A0A8H4RJ35_9HELO|nr:hypothetical protein G7Y89_g8327 [Cudoniella acicularis]
MNWTGGRLQRHSGAAGTLKNRQQQHFARIKANLLNGKKKSPRKTSANVRIPVSNAENRRQPSISISDSRRVHRRSDSHTIQPHSFLPDPGTILHSDGAQSQDHQTLRRDASISIKEENFPEEDLYSATPPPRGLKREREVSIVGSEENNQPDQEEPLSEKRRKLLRKGDWVSVGFQQPPQFQFTSPRKAGKVGRRRAVTDQHRARYTRKIQVQITSPFTRRNPAQHDPNREPFRAGRSDVRISIGGRIVPPGVSSSSAHSKKHSHSSHKVLSNRAPSRSSEVMLLDNEVIASHPHFSPTVQEIERIRSDRNFSNREFWQKNALSPEGLESSYPGNGQVEVLANGRNTSIEHPDRSFNGLHNARSQIPGERARNENINSEAFTTPNQSLHVFSSSSAPIQHPKPKSLKVSPLLLSDTSQGVDSTAAQVGPIKPVVPSSQVLDNEIWETWMTAIYPDDDSGASGGHILDNPPISPGVSAAPVYMQYQGDVDLEVEQANSPFAGFGYPTEPEGGLERDASVLPQASQLDTPQQEEAPGMLSQYELSELLASTLSPLSVTSLKNLTPIPEEDFEVINQITTIEPPVTQHILNETQHQREVINAEICVERNEAETEDPDEIWRRFVFGSDSEKVDIFHDLRLNHNVETVHEEFFESVERENSAPEDSSHDRPFSQHTTSSQRSEWSHFRDSRSPLRSDLATGDVSASLQSSSPMRPLDTPSYRPRRAQIVMFTKPQCFIESKLGSDSCSDRGNLLHIGKSFIETKKSAGPKSRQENGNVNSLPGSDEEIKSIEDN